MDPPASSGEGEQAVPALLEQLPALARRLLEIQQRALLPPDAQREVRALSLPAPWRADLFWEREPATGELSYDLVLTSEDGRRSFCLAALLDDDLPWPMRAACRWSDQELGKVNGRSIRIDQAIHWLDLVGGSRPLLDRVLEQAIIETELAEQEEIPAGELQGAMDAIRVARGLLTREATLQWMQREGVSAERLEREAVRVAALTRLRDRVAAGQVEAEHQNNADHYRTVVFDVLECMHRETALRARKSLETAGQSVRDAWEAGLRAAAPDPEVSFSSRVSTAWELEDELGFDLSAIAPGATFLAEPGRGHPSRHSLVQVLRVIPAPLDAATVASIKRRLFKRWLGERCRQARVEWFWGPARPPATSHEPALP